MSAHTDCVKLAGVMNRASQQGKAGFVRMLWGNQPDEVQTELRPLLSAEALDALAEEE